MPTIQSVTTSFIGLWRSSALIQGFLALLFGGAIVYMEISQIQASDALIGALFAIIGFYFGAKNRTT